MESLIDSVRPIGNVGAVRRLGIGGDMNRRWTSVNSAAGVMVDKEFVYEKKNITTEEYLAQKENAKRIRKRFLIEVFLVLGALSVAAFLLFFVLL